MTSTGVMTSPQALSLHDFPRWKEPCSLLFAAWCEHDAYMLSDYELHAQGRDMEWRELLCSSEGHEGMVAQTFHSLTDSIRHTILGPSKLPSICESRMRASSDIRELKYLFLCTLPEHVLTAQEQTTRAPEQAQAVTQASVRSQRALGCRLRAQPLRTKAGVRGLGKHSCGHRQNADREHDPQQTGACAAHTGPEVGPPRRLKR